MTGRRLRGQAITRSRAGPLWRGRLAELLERGGLAKNAARRFATVLIASAEGAGVMSRAQRDLEPFETVAKPLLDQARTLGARPGAKKGPEGPS